LYREATLHKAYRTRKTYRRQLLKLTQSVNSQKGIAIHIFSMSNVISLSMV